MRNWHGNKSPFGKWHTSTSVPSIYAVLGIDPALAFDFEGEYFRVGGNPATFSNAITHTRASTATYVDSTGTLQTAAINQPRLGHHVWNGSAWVNEGLLHESEARTNVLEYSSELDNAYWAKAGSRTEVIANQITAPDGTLTADLVRAITGATTGEQFVRKGFNGLSGTYTTSAFVKKANWRYITIRAGDNICIFDFDTFAFTLSTGNTVSVQDFGDGWYRISASQTVLGTTDYATIGTAPDATTASWGTAPASNEGVYVWGMQYESAPTPSSYIPTAGSTVTRAADVLTVPAANLPYPTPTVIGPELVTNGTFDTDTDWTKGSQWTITGGKAVSTPSAATGDNLIIRQDNNLVETGKVYAVTYTVSDRTAGAVAMFVRGSSPAVYHSTNDTFTRYVVAGSGGRDLEFLANQTFDGSIDNISVREINPLAVSIQMDGRVTYADRNLSDEATFYRWQVDFNDRITAQLHSGVGTGAAFFIQVDGGVFDSVISGSVYAPDTLVSYNISSRHGSTFINGAVDGVSLTADTTPVALPDLSATDLRLGFGYNGTIRTFRMWGQDIGDTGLVEATT